MKVKVKLFAMLGRYLPPGSKDNQAELEVGENASAKSVIDGLHLPERLDHLVLLNGAYLPPGERDKTHLKDGDALAIWPPIAGGETPPPTQA